MQNSAIQVQHCWSLFWAFQDVNLERCWVRIRCDSKHHFALEAESCKVRKDVLVTAWHEEEERKNFDCLITVG